jgi:Tol biopolymer transport system component
VLHTPEREESWPFWSPVVRRVAFVRGGPGLHRGRLWLWNPETGEQSPATGETRRWESWPNWSPVAPLLVYDSQKRGRGGIEILDVTSGRREIVAHSPNPGDHYLRPTFGPRADLLVAQHFTGGQNDLFLLREGRPPEPLVVTPDAEEEKPVFTNDGRSVLFTEGPVDGGPRRLMRVDVATHETATLLSEPGADTHTIAVSPVREEIAFVKERDGRADIWLLDLASGRTQPVAETPDWDEYAPHWSPDGELIVTTAARHGSPDPDPHLRVLDRQGAVVFDTTGFSPDWMPPPAAP